MTDSPYILLVAMAREAGLVIPRLNPWRAVAGRPAYRGRLGSKNVVLAQSGMGLANAALCAGALLERLPQARGLINLGCAGAYAGSGLGLGRAVVASGAVFADMGVLNQRGPRGLEVIGIPLFEAAGHKLYNKLPVDESLSGQLAAGGLPRGVFASVGLVSGDAPTAAEYEKRWEAVLEDMETAAVALAALACKVPFAAVRGVSNIAGHRELDLAAGAEAAQEALLAWAQVEAD